MPTPAPAVFRGAQGAAGSSLADYAALQALGVPDDRLIVRTVIMSLLVEDVPGTLESVASLARDLGGFVVSSTLSGEEESRFGHISIRVPAEQTDAVLAQLRAVAVRVKSEQSTARDVTEEYVDLQARLSNLERTEEQYLSLLGRAESVEDTLKVQRELSNVQGQVEQLKGRMQYLEQTSATSLVTAELRTASSPRRLVQPGWSPLETAQEALRGLAGFGQGVVDVAIRVGVFAPVWVPLAALLLFPLRWLVRRVRARQQR